MADRKKHLQIIDDNSVLFIKDFDIDEMFIAHLREKHILQPHDIDDLSEKTGRQRNIYFLHKLRKRPQRSFDNLLEIFNEVGHPEISSRLSEGYNIPHKELSKEQVNRIRTIIHPLVLNKKLSIENQAKLLKTVVAKTDYDDIRHRLILVSEELEEFKNQVERKETQIAKLTNALQLKESEYHVECDHLINQIHDLKRIKSTLENELRDSHVNYNKNLDTVRKDLATRDENLQSSGAKIVALEKEKEHISRELTKALETVPKTYLVSNTRRVAQEHEDNSENENTSERLQELSTEIQAYADGIEATNHKQEQLKQAANSVLTKLEEAKRKNNELQHLAINIANFKSSHVPIQTGYQIDPYTKTWVTAQHPKSGHVTWPKAPQPEDNSAFVPRQEVIYHFEVGECKVDAASLGSNTTDTKSTDSTDSSVYEDCVDCIDDPNASSIHKCSSNNKCLSEEISKPVSHPNKAHAQQSSSNAKHNHNIQRRSSHVIKQKNHSKGAPKANISLELKVHCSSVCHTHGDNMRPLCDPYESPMKKLKVPEIRIENTTTLPPACNTKNYIQQNQVLQRRPHTSRVMQGNEKHAVRQHQFEFPPVPRSNNYMNMRRTNLFPGLSLE